MIDRWIVGEVLVFIIGLIGAYVVGWEAHKEWMRKKGGEEGMSRELREFCPICGEEEPCKCVRGSG